MSGDKTPLVGRPFVQMHTAVLLDDDLLEVSALARWVLTALLLHSAGQGGNGWVTTTPRKVSRIAGLDSSSDAADALRELVNAGLLVLGGDDQAYVSWWDRQAGLPTDVTDGRKGPGQALRQHAAGRHAARRNPKCLRCQHGAAEHSTPVNACPDCQQLAAALAVPDDGSGPERPASEALTVAEVKERVWRYADKVLAQADARGVDAVEAYRAVLAAVPQAVADYGQVKGVTGAVLENTVVSHAGTWFLTREGVKPTQGTLRKLQGLHRAWGADAFLDRLALAAAKRDPLAYLAGIARREAMAA